jgi:hypothetical protein
MLADIGHESLLNWNFFESERGRMKKKFLALLAAGSATVFFGGCQKDEGGASDTQFFGGNWKSCWVVGSQQAIEGRVNASWNVRYELKYLFENEFVSNATVKVFATKDPKDTIIGWGNPRESWGNWELKDAGQDSFVNNGKCGSEGLAAFKVHFINKQKPSLTHYFFNNDQNGPDRCTPIAKVEVWFDNCK